MTNSVESSRGGVSHALPHMRHGRLRSPNPIVAIVKLIGVALIVLAVSVTSVAGFAVYSTFAQVKPGIHLQHVGGATAPANPTLGPVSGEVNLLLAGTDTRTNQAGFQDKANVAASSGAGSNDVTMLLHVSADHTSATVVSFPRDMVNVPFCGGSISGSMFNATLSQGLSCTVQTVEKMTGLTIPYAGVISFDGVIGMSNAIGGVTVCVASPIVDKYTGLNLPAGQITLKGSTALEFLRTRHGVADGSDLGRISNQQVFLSALVRKITSAGVLSNPITMYSLANAALANIHMSDTLTNPTSVVSVALALKGISLNNIVFVQYPTFADPANPNRLIPDTRSGAALDAALQSDQPIALSGTLGRAAVTAPSSSPAPTPSASAPATTKPSGSPGQTVGPTPTPSPSSIVVPPSITGQAASQSTCSKGN
ncbi:MAG: LytR family transcriptional regulator [Microbacteriaceae bacterium]|jgi:LCP family protein required for cell wall assembly|nr:LytR family transcriptional regulator [Microbacteriaceae bacterium]